MKSIETILIIDGNNKLWASYFAYSKLSHKGKSVASIFGMTSMVRHYVNKFKPNKCFIVWDGNKSKHRLKLIPDYKEGRSQKSLIDFEDFDRQKREVMKMLNFLGIPQIRNMEYEADDLIYKLYRKLKSKKRRFIICSTDKDFNQMVSKRVNVWVDKPKLRALITPKNIETHFDYKASECVDYLSLVGDSSDNIPGYKGIGPVKAKKFLKEFKSIRNFLKGDNSFPGVDMREMARVFKKNHKMISLEKFYNSFSAYDKRALSYIKGSNPSINYKKFYAKARKYGLNKFMGEGFIKPFKSLSR